MTAKRKPQMTSVFELSGKTYVSDAETLSVLRSIVPSASGNGDAAAVAVVMDLGLMIGRIKEIDHSLKGES